jgi:uncharacterized repeat protein (TIGR03837 family)
MTPDRAWLCWDIYCRVVDNFGDIGVCWRLAAQLAALGDRVRLIVDDASALDWMAPQRAQASTGVTVLPWPGPITADAAPDVVIEAFGCDLPEPALRAMCETDPVWINLEYLSAEDYVERSHGLPSPRQDGLRKWFFYPGFTERTGGLLREPGLMQRRSRFDREAWLISRGWARRPGERVVTLFCYENPAIGPWVQALAEAPTLLLLAPGPAQRQVQATPPAVRTVGLPWLDQTNFDHLLWASDLNAVRGEDSLVRALWAGVPFLWQAYPQPDGAHAAKLRALLALLALPAEAAAANEAWNGLAAWKSLPPLAPWHAATEAARGRLLRQDDLVVQLRRFVVARRR